MIVPVYKDGKLFSVKNVKKFTIYNNGVGIREVLNQLHKQGEELKRLKKKKRSKD